MSKQLPAPLLYGTGALAAWFAYRTWAGKPLYDVKLSKHFWLSQLTHTNTGLPNTPPPWVVYRLWRLANTLLEPMWDIYGPLVVTSGYRGLAVNTAVGGKKGSKHGDGTGVDVYVIDWNWSTNTGRIQKEAMLQSLAQQKLPFRLAIAYAETSHVHVDQGGPSNRMLAWQPAPKSSKKLIPLNY